MSDNLNALFYAMSDNDQAAFMEGLLSVLLRRESRGLRDRLRYAVSTDQHPEAHSTGAALQFPDEPVDVTEEPPVGSQVTDRDGDVFHRFADGWTMWDASEWGAPGGKWGNIRFHHAPLRPTTDADRERVGLPVDTAPDVDPDEAMGPREGRLVAEADLRHEVAEHDKTRATVLRLTRERDEAEARCERLSVLAEKGERYEALRAGIDDLRRDAMTANAVEPSRALHETAIRCAALLNPTEGETDE